MNDTPRRRVCALAVLTWALAGCSHQANFPLYAQNDTARDAELHVAFVREQDGKSVWDRMFSVPANAPMSEQPVAKIILEAGKYAMRVDNGDLAAERVIDFGSGTAGVRIVIRESIIDLQLTSF